MMKKSLYPVLFSFVVFLSCKDEDILSPDVETVGAEEVTASWAILRGDLVALGTFPVIDVGFQHGTDSLELRDEPVISSLDLKTGEKGSFRLKVTGLQGQTKYYFRAAASTGEENVFGEIKSFTTQ